MDAHRGVDVEAEDSVSREGEGGEKGRERERDDGGICVEASEREREREEGNQREEVTE